MILILSWVIMGYKIRQTFRSAVTLPCGVSPEWKPIPGFLKLYQTLKKRVRSRFTGPEQSQSRLLPGGRLLVPEIRYL